MSDKKVIFQDTELSVELLNYQNNNSVAIQLNEATTGEPWLTASVNVDAELAEDEVAIKDYSENEGVLAALVEAGIVSQPIKIISSGFVNIPICKLLISKS